MSNHVNSEEASRERLKKVQELQTNKWELWKFYEDRAERLSTNLWSIGTWLMAVMTATIALPFIAKFIETANNFPYLIVKNHVGATSISVFGICICIYFYAALHDVREHIEKNWRKASYILEKKWESNWEGRKNHAWKILFTVGWLAFTGFVALFLIAISG